MGVEGEVLAKTGNQKVTALKREDRDRETKKKGIR
jgi:ribosomal protein L21